MAREDENMQQLASSEEQEHDNRNERKPESSYKDTSRSDSGSVRFVLPFGSFRFMSFSELWFAGLLFFVYALQTLPNMW